MVATVVIRSPADQEAFDARLTDLTPALEVIGELGVSAAQAAFSDQEFGSVKWLPRYPNQSGGAFINIAGAVADLSGGGQIKARRFDRRPAGLDSGDMQRTIRSTVLGKNAVEYGATTSYADDFQKGGTSSMPVSDGTKKKLSAFLAKNPEFKPRLDFVLEIDELVTTNVPRPFIGVTDTLASDMIEVVEEYLSGGEDGGT